MDIVLLIILIISNIVMAHRIGELRPAKTYPPQYELTPAKQHRLVRTWLEATPTDGGWEGWRFLCQCGTTGPAVDLDKESLGSETSAVEQFTIHAKLFASVDEDGWKRRYEEKKAELDSYVSRCYCKETNDELIEYRGK
jgi:hypothetical protein